jgi:hypothetical protein
MSRFPHHVYVGGVAYISWKQVLQAVLDHVETTPGEEFAVCDAETLEITARIMLDKIKAAKEESKRVKLLAESLKEGLRGGKE